MTDSAEPRPQLTYNDRVKRVTGFSIEPHTPQEIQVGNLLVTPILTEHDQGTFLRNGSKIVQQLDPFDIVIPEYLPPEFEKNIRNDPALIAGMIATNYEEQNYLFYRLQEYLEKHNKNIWVVDPAYSRTAADFRVQENWPYVAATAAGEAALLTGSVVQLHDEAKKKH